MNAESLVSSWTKHFKVSEEDKKKWEKAKSTSESLLSYALKQKAIPREEYFDWAREHHQIPFLKTDFFQNPEILSKSKWKKIKDLETWSQQMLPVSFWEDIVYIGCIEPCGKTLSFPHRFVLASDLSLKMLWNILYKEQSTPVQSTNHSGKLSEKTVTGKVDLSESKRKVIVMKEYKDRMKSAKNLQPELTEETLEIGTGTGIYTINKSRVYEKLWEKTKNYFSGIIIFKRQSNYLIPERCVGRIVLKDENFKVNLKETTLFSIINKNFPYHGPVIGTQANKEIFQNIGWETALPKHISAFAPAAAHKKVFFGVGGRQVKMTEIGKITDLIEKFFEENELLPLKQAA